MEITSKPYLSLFYLYTKMRNVGGIAQTEAQKSSDLFMKCRYLDEITGGRGTVFATGTPISNSMVELYTIQRYLQYSTLVKNGLQHFDAWASTFGETITAVELTPEGTGYRAKTRFAKFYNLPELMAMFKEIADIKTADMLNLPVPEAKYHNIAVKPSEMQKEMVASLAERAEQVRGGGVDSSVDNMLKITNDGRKLALDQRMLNDMLPDFEGSKINACVDNIYRIWEENADKKSAQLVFCDLSTPKNDGTFSVYNDIRKKLIERGIPESEVKFIHEADTDMKKKELFQKTRKGEVRVLLGSTQKMGAGTNVQDKLIALHDVDCPWRPSDLEQRSGRIVRQGNENPQVDIYRYVTEQTFDAYLYQLVEGKQKFASQIMTSKSPVRSAEDIDETALSYAEIKMLATGNPYIKEKMDLDIQVQKLKMLKSNFLSEKYGLEDKVIKFYPQQIAYLKSRVEGLTKDVKTAKLHPKPIDEQPLGMTVSGVSYLLEKKGYEVRVLDLISMEKSHCYNPFVYLQNDNDVQKLVTNLFKSTTPKGSQSNDPFWDTAASMLLLALVFYLHYEAPPEEQNFAMVMEMLRAGAIEDEDDPSPSPLDNLFSDLMIDNPDHIALKYYHSYHSGSSKTLKSIQITLAARLEKFNLESLAALTSADELDLQSLGEKKVALFALIPDNDSSFNFLVSILYTQLLY